MKKEKLITICICLVFICFAIFIYFRDLKSESNNEEIIVTESPTFTPVFSYLKEEKTSNEEENNSSLDKTIRVYVCGAVKNPGVYRFDPSSRIVDAVDYAGGFTRKASKNYLNLADFLWDGERLIIPTKKQVKKLKKEDSNIITQSVNANSDKVNINSASKEELMNLSGVGEAKADAIIAYREENGGFSSIDEIMNISGIKEGVFNSIKDLICV